MRPLSRVISLILILTATTAMAQGPQSFRSIATGGTIDDNLDLSFDPIELRYIEGMHFYTNLSNLTSTNEQMLNNVCDNEFLFGVALPNPWVANLWTAAAVRMENSEMSNGVAIDPDLGYGTQLQENGFGFLSYDYTAWLDTDFDGVYDQQQSISQEVTDYVTNDSYDFTLNNTFVMTDLGTFGLLIARRSQEMTGDRSSATLGSGAYAPLNQQAAGTQTFGRTAAIHDEGGDYDIIDWSESGTFETTNSNSNTWVNMAFMTEWNDYEVRGDFGINSGSDIMENSDSYRGEVVNNDPNISGYVDTYEESDRYDGTQTDEGTSFNLGCSIRETFQPAESRLQEGFWQGGVNLQFGGCDYEESMDSRFRSTEDYFDGDAAGFTDFTEVITENELTSDKGTAGDFGFGFFGVYNRQFGDNLSFGFGAGWNSFSTSRETDFLVDYELITDFDYNDNTVNDDYVRTETQTFSADRTWERTVSSFTCPVGVEYRTGKRNQWAWRCGSRFVRTAEVITDELAANESECTSYTIVTEYDGATPDTETITDNLYGSSNEENHNTFSNTTFYYGLGWEPTDNLQIDMIYMFAGGFDFIDSDFFRDLRISVTLNN